MRVEKRMENAKTVLNNHNSVSRTHIICVISSQARHAEKQQRGDFKAPDLKFIAAI